MARKTCRTFSCLVPKLFSKTEQRIQKRFIVSTYDQWLLRRDSWLWTDSENDIENLIERTENETPEAEQSGGNKDALFSFAKVWSAEKDSLEEMSEETAKQAEQVDSWAQTLERIAAERQLAQAEEAIMSGRGVRRKAAATFVCYFLYDLFSDRLTR